MPSAAHLLYDDALHSIYSFIEINTSSQYTVGYGDILQPALTCKRWFSAASSMHFKYRPDLMKSVLNTRNLPIRKTDRITIFTSSGLRNLLLAVRFADMPLERLMHYFVDTGFAQKMQHIHTLRLTMEFGMDTKVEEWMAKKEENEADSSSSSSLCLPSSLRHLVLEFCCAHTSKYIDAQSETAVSNVRSEVHTKLGEIMTMFTDATKKSSPLLERLEMALYTAAYDRSYVPACALSPWASIKTIRHLNCFLPSQQCVEVLRTMQQLESFQSIDKDTEWLLERLVFGDKKAFGAMKLADGATPPILPPLLEYSLRSPTSRTLALLSHFTTLTDVSLASCEHDPGEVLFSKLPHLRVLNLFYQYASGKAKMLFDAMVKYAPLLENLDMTHANVFDTELAEFIPKMAQLKYLRLSGCWQVKNLSWLADSRPALQEVYLSGLTVGRAHLAQTKHIAKVKIA